MRKLLLSALIASGLTFSGVSVYGQATAPEEEEVPPAGSTAAEDIPVEEVTGEVVNFDESLSTIAIKTEDGKTVPLVAKHPTHLEGLKAGDMVTAKVAGGALALSITKAAESEPAPIEEEAPAPEQESAPEAQ